MVYESWLIQILSVAAPIGADMQPMNRDTRTKTPRNEQKLEPNRSQQRTVHHYHYAPSIRAWMSFKAKIESRYRHAPR